MNFLYYNDEGWVCERYPYYYHIEKSDQYLVVDDTVFAKTTKIKPYKAFKVVNGVVTECDTNVLYPTGFSNDELIELLKELLKSVKEDVEQVELFGMNRDDYEQKKQQCIEIILKLRELENE